MQKTAYYLLSALVGSDMCLRDSPNPNPSSNFHPNPNPNPSSKFHHNPNPKPSYKPKPCPL